VAFPQNLKDRSEHAHESTARLSASALLEKTSVAALAQLLEENADEPRAAELATALAGKKFATTRRSLTRFER